MKGLKTKILKNIAEQIKKIAQAAAGNTSQWSMYQPEEPKIVDRVENKRYHTFINI